MGKFFTPITVLILGLSVLYTGCVVGVSYMDTLRTHDCPK